jgi:alpha-amylase/alpha-mannosidase (GH57 family)
MPAKVHLALVWHMHQPSYANPQDQARRLGAARAGGPRAPLLLPWVRLHGASAYRDMTALLLAHPGVRVTVNLSPTLLAQLRHYLGGGGDEYEALTLRPADQLTPEERLLLVQRFFSVHWGNVLERMPAYLGLLEKRGREIPSAAWGDVIERFSTDELRDLQVLFNLSWLGLSASEHEGVKPLLGNGRAFREQDKALVLDAQRTALSQVLPAWKELIARGQVEALCSPDSHPILPLLCDSSIARRSQPDVRLPERFCFAEDAALQLTRGRAAVKAELGVEATGLWPPELAVSPEAVQLCSRLGFDYLITDGEVLFRSLDDRGSTPGKRRLYQAYHMNGCTLFFRDRVLSDSIGREYATWTDHDAAAEDFVRRVLRVADEARLDGSGPPLVVVALDGENPWEAYPRRGWDFLSALYGRLESTPEIRCVTLREQLQSHPPTVGIEHLHSGSWIEANFAIWIGDPDKNRAWNMLGQARRRLARARAGEEADQAALDHALFHALRAECSDWFWWLGEPFSSAEEPVYEGLFRAHLTALYRALGDSPPADLSRPIEHGGIVEPIRQPTAFIQPRLDGKRTSFFEWRGAGFYRVPAAGSVYQPHSVINGLYWGFDAGRLFLRMDPTDEGGGGLRELEVWFELSEAERSFQGLLDLRGERPSLMLSLDEEGRRQDLGSIVEVSHQEVAELAVPLSRLGLRPGARVGLSVHFAREGQLLSRVPRQGVIEIQIPDSELSLEG